MRSFIYSLLALMCLAATCLPPAYAQTAFTTSDPSGTVTCNTSGNCTSITFTPVSDSNSYMFQYFCLTTTPISPVTANTVLGFNGGPCASLTGFNSSMFGTCNQGWNDTCAIDVTSGGLGAGTYTVYAYIYYTYCPTADLSNGGCSVGNDGAEGYQEVQTVALTGTVPSSTPSVPYTWTPGAWGTCSSAGTQTRTVSCEDGSGNVVSSSYCTASEPATSQPCTPSSTSPQTPSCTDPSCTAVNSGPGVTMPNCTPDPSKGKFCIVVPTKQ